jgi:probable F420-dependent oxidoreductase
LATLDVFSGGRVEFGIGAGWQAADYERTGSSFDPGRTRFKRLQEAVQVFRGLFGPGPFSFQGRHYEITDYDARPKPLQSPMPFTVGAGGPRMLAFAARQADTVNLLPRALPHGGMDLSDTSPGAFGAKVERIRAAAGERLDELEIATLVHRVVVTDSAGEVEEAARRTASVFNTSPDIARESPVVLIGPVSYMVEKLLERKERFGLTYFSILADNIEAFAPVVASLAGELAPAREAEAQTRRARFQ